MLAAVNVGAKYDSFVADVTEPGQAEYLVTTAIGKYCFIPRHKTVQPTHFFDDTYSWPQVDMVGIGQQHPYSQVLQFFRGHCFNRGLATHRCEYRRRNHPVRCNHCTGPGITAGIGLGEAKAIGVVYYPVLPVELICR